MNGRRQSTYVTKTNGDILGFPDGCAIDTDYTDPTTMIIDWLNTAWGYTMWGVTVMITL